MATRICKNYIKGEECPEWAYVQTVSCKGYKDSCPYYEPKPYKREATHGMS